MANYVIGDLQGCYQPLCRLLDMIHYDPGQDFLWFAGDIVNRGPDSLDCLRFVANQPNCRMVLGNHDLYCLVVGYGYWHLHPKDTLAPIYEAPDSDTLLTWLLHQPLLIQESGYCLVHAGILPLWDQKEASQHAREVEWALQNDTANFLQHLFGQQPDTWDVALAGYDRLRFITNVFTRMRYCYSSYQLDFTFKGRPADAPKDRQPWFMIPERKMANQPILFGHWSALEGSTSTPSAIALDTGYVWGGGLTALRLEDKQRFYVSNPINKNKK